MQIAGEQFLLIIFLIIEKLIKYVYSILNTLVVFVL